MDNELNKAFAGLLVAGIVAMTCGFIGKGLVSPHALEQPAYAVDTSALAAASSAGGAEEAAGPEDISALLASADVAQGEKLSKACAACHTFDKGGANKVGPNLFGIVGASKAHLADFAYSDAMKASGGSWSEDSLNHFLWKPKAYVAGTKMNYVGLKKPEDRAAMIKWLSTLR